MDEPTPLLASPREDVICACRKLAADGLVRGMSGNVSVRQGDHIAVSATGAVLADIGSGDVTVVDRAGMVIEGERPPTSELGLHLAVYDRDISVGAVVHTHAPMATALACVVDEVPVVHYEMLALGGSIRVAGYETFGTDALADAAVNALEGRSAALLSNHGTVTTGVDVAAAMRATELLEWLCGVYWHAAAIGTPRILDEAQQQHFLDESRRRRYGQLGASPR